MVARRRTDDPATNSRVTVLIAERKATELENAGARKKMKTLEIPPLTSRAEVEASAASTGVESTLRTCTVACARVLTTGLAIVRSEELKRV